MKILQSLRAAHTDPVHGTMLCPASRAAAAGGGWQPLVQREDGIGNVACILRIRARRTAVATRRVHLLREGIRACPVGNAKSIAAAGRKKMVQLPELLGAGVTRRGAHSWDRAVLLPRSPE